MWVLRIKPGSTERATRALNSLSSLHSSQFVITCIHAYNIVFCLHLFVFVNTSESKHKQSGIVPVYLPSYFFFKNLQSIVFLIQDSVSRTQSVLRKCSFSCNEQEPQVSVTHFIEAVR